MKIKTKKQINLLELIEYKKSKKRGGFEVFISDCGLYEVRTSETCLDYIIRPDFGEGRGLPAIPFDTTFTVEVEEELTEDTVLTLSEYEHPTCESCWREYEELLYDGVNYVCVDCYERNETINESSLFK